MLRSLEQDGPIGKEFPDVAHTRERQRAAAVFDEADVADNDVTPGEREVATLIFSVLPFFVASNVYSRDVLGEWYELNELAADELFHFLKRNLEGIELVATGYFG